MSVNNMWGIYLPADMFPFLDGQEYPVNLYGTQKEAEDDLPRVVRKWGHRAFIREATR